MGITLRWLVTERHERDFTEEELAELLGVDIDDIDGVSAEQVGDALAEIEDGTTYSCTIDRELISGWPAVADQGSADCVPCLAETAPHTCDPE